MWWPCLPLVLALAVDQSSASCFGKDAHFKTTDVSFSVILRKGEETVQYNVYLQQPLVSQVSRTDPQQVLVTWDKIIKRPECVDRYHVWVWPEGTERTSKVGRKILVEEKERGKKTVATSKTVSVEPCLNYK